MRLGAHQHQGFRRLSGTQLSVIDGLRPPSELKLHYLPILSRRRATPSTLGVLFWGLAAFVFDALDLWVHFSPIQGTDGTETPMDDSPSSIWAALNDAPAIQICLPEMLIFISDVPRGI